MYLQRDDAELVTVICSFCSYVGQNRKAPNSLFRELDYEIQDVEEHEKTCPERPMSESTPDLIVNFQGEKMLVVKVAVVETKPWKKGQKSQNQQS